MVLEIVIGIALGGAALTALGVWYTRKQLLEEEAYIDSMEEEYHQPTTQTTLLLDLPLEKKLRDAIYECTRGFEKCQFEIERLCNLQLDLLQDIGEPTYFHIPNKEAYFVFENIVSADTRYYYYREIYPNIEPEILSETQHVLFLYNDHIDLLKSKLELFERLKESHQENLDRLTGVVQQNAQLAKIKRHKDKIANLTEQHELEKKAIFNEALLERIEEELNFQEECLRQYVQLSHEFDVHSDIPINKDYKIKIQDLINKIEDKDSAKED